LSCVKNIERIPYVKGINPEISRKRLIFKAMRGKIWFKQESNGLFSAENSSKNFQTDSFHVNAVRKTLFRTTFVRKQFKKVLGEQFSRERCPEIFCEDRIHAKTVRKIPG